MSFRYAILAPSSHNTQPWHFVVDGSELLICADRTRSLPNIDPFDRELIMSCGAALFNLRVALAHFNVPVAIATFPYSAEPDVVARVTFADSGPALKDLSALFDAITKRATNRAPFFAEDVPDAFVERLRWAAEAEGVNVAIVRGPIARARVAALIAEADQRQFDDPRFRRELASWIHSSRSSDGMPALSQGLPALTDFTTKIPQPHRRGNLSRHSRHKLDPYQPLRFLIRFNGASVACLFLCQTRLEARRCGSPRLLPFMSACRRSFMEAPSVSFRYAILAPSSHNTQPWHFVVDGSELLICADRTRSLPNIDPFDRELIMSCGAALFDLRVALAHFNVPVAIATFPYSAEPDVVARVTFADSGPALKDLSALFDAITKRATNRAPFFAEDVPDAFVERLRWAAEAEGVNVAIVRGPIARARVAALIAEADQRQFDDPRFRRELASWIHSSRSSDGMPALSQGLPALTDFTTKIAAMTNSYFRRR